MHHSANRLYIKSICKSIFLLRETAMQQVLKYFLRTVPFFAKLIPKRNPKRPSNVFILQKSSEKTKSLEFRINWFMLLLKLKKKGQFEGQTPHFEQESTV